MIEHRKVEVSDVELHERMARIETFQQISSGILQEIKALMQHELDRTRENEDKIAGQGAELGKAQRDINSIGQRMRDHYEAHKWWAVFIFSIVSIMIKVIDWIDGIRNAMP